MPEQEIDAHPVSDFGYDPMGVTKNRVGGEHSEGDSASMIVPEFSKAGAMARRPALFHLMDAPQRVLSTVSLSLHNAESRLMASENSCG